MVIRSVSSPVDYSEKGPIFCEEERGKQLLKAVIAGNIEAVRKLLDEQVDPNIADKDGRTPLHFAIDYEETQIARILIEKNAELNVQDHYGSTPLHLAIRKANIEIIELLVEKKIDFSLLNGFGYTPLHYALFKGDDSIATFLIERDAGLDILDSCDRTPLHIAIIYKKTEIARFLINRGVDLNVRSNDGRTPLHCAVSSGNFEITTILVEKNADLSIKDNCGRLPLHSAIVCGNSQIARLLIDKSVDVNERDNQGNTPLHEAIFRENAEIAMLLMEKKAELNIQNSKGQTPLYLAIVAGNISLVRLLIQRDDAFVVRDSSRDLRDLNSILVEIFEYRDSRMRKSILKDICKSVGSESGHRALEFLGEFLKKREIQILKYRLLKNDYGGLADLLKKQQGIQKELKRAVGGERDSLSEQLENIQAQIRKPKENVEKALVFLGKGELQEAKKLLEVSVKLKKHSAICCYLIGLMIPEDILLQEMDSIIEAFLNKIDLKDATNHLTVTSTLYRLFQNDELTKNEKIAVVKKMIAEVYKKTDGRIAENSKKSRLEAFLRVVSIVHVIAKLKETERLKEFIGNTEDSIICLKRILSDFLSSKFNLEGVEDISDKYNLIFGDITKFRNSEAIFIYMSNLDTHPVLNKAEECKKLFSTYVRDVLEGKYREERYSLEKSIHLKTVFGGEFGSELLKKWKQNETFPLSSLEVAYDTDDPCDFLLMGDEVLISCQRLDGNPEANSGLLGPLLDGKYRLIVVKNEKRQIVARCLLKILWDSKTGRPVLFKEKFYIADKNKQLLYSDLLNKMCEKKARTMNLLLLQKLCEGEIRIYPNTVESLGGRSSVEYVDAIGGIRGNVYKIKSSAIVWEPPKLEDS